MNKIFAEVCLFMYGAIFGDIRSVLQKQEYDNIYFLVDRKIKFTDYTVTAFALADALTSVNGDDDARIKEKITQSFIECGRIFTNKEFFNPKFEQWLDDEQHLPTKYEDNGTVARAAIIPYLYHDSERIKELAKLAAEVTCGNSRSIFNAQFAAIAVHYAMWHLTKNDIKTSLEYFIGSDITDVAKNKNIVAEAALDFLNSSNLETAVENAISRGGDITARAVIAGSMAEAFYGVPFTLKAMCNSKLPEELLEILSRFEKVAKKNFFEVSDEGVSASEEGIEEAISRFRENETLENFNILLEEIYYSMCDNGNLRVPLIVHDRDKMYADTKLPDDTDYLYLHTKDGRKFVAAFTGEDEKFISKYPDVYLATIESIFSEVVEGEVDADGIVLNPDNVNLTVALDKEDLKKILEHKSSENQLLLFDGHISKLTTSAVVTSNYEGFKNISLPNHEAVIYAHFMKKFPESAKRCIIYSPLGFYEGANTNVVFDCCQACLDLAKKYHFTSIAFPFYFAFAGGLPVFNAAINDWFNHNQNYGMTVICATGTEKDRDNDDDKNFFAVNFAEKNVEDVPAEKNIPAERGNLKFDYSKGKALSTSAEAKQKARDFKNQFANPEDFYTALKNFGFTWKAENSNSEKIKNMWALNALACAIDEYNFDPFLQD